RDVNGKIRPRLGNKMGVITKIFANPVVPQIDDYYEPFTFDYEHLHSAPEGKHIPTARPRSLIDGKRMDKVIWGPNWEELLGGEFEKRARDRNFEAM
ncbi:nitrate reductase subunit beta, partial [Escherichia coli]